MDKSGAHLLGGASAPRHPLGLDELLKDQHLYDVQELTPREAWALKNVGARVENQFIGEPLTAENFERLSKLAKDMYAEIGFVVEVTLTDVMGVDDSTDNLYHSLAFELVGRTHKHQVDYEEIKHQVQAGEADGRAGGIRDDGTFREDLRKTSY